MNAQIFVFLPKIIIVTTKIPKSLFLPPSLSSSPPHSNLLRCTLPPDSRFLRHQLEFKHYILWDESNQGVQGTDSEELVPKAWVIVNPVVAVPHQLDFPNWPTPMIACTQHGAGCELQCSSEDLFLFLMNVKIIIEWKVYVMG